MQKYTIQELYVQKQVLQVAALKLSSMFKNKSISCICLEN